MNLLQLAHLYLSTRVGVSQRYRRELLAVAQRCTRELGQVNGHLPSQAELAGWLQSLIDSGRSPATAATYRRMLRAVLRFGEREGYCGHYELPAVRVPRRAPRAWTADEVSRIVVAATTWPGTVGRHLACHWWPALLLTCYYSGARIGSIMAAEPFDWNPQHMTLTLRHTKSSAAQVCRLHPQAAKAIARIYDPQAERLFVWPYHRRHLFTVCRRIVEAAGVPCPRRKFNLFHRLRRTALTYCWAVDPAVAQRQGGHSSAEITRRHYVDPRIAADGLCAADILPPIRLPQERQLRLF